MGFQTTYNWEPWPILCESMSVCHILKIRTALLNISFSLHSAPHLVSNSLILLTQSVILSDLKQLPQKPGVFKKLVRRIKYDLMHMYGNYINITRILTLEI